MLNCRGVDNKMTYLGNSSDPEEIEDVMIQQMMLSEN